MPPQGGVIFWQGKNFWPVVERFGYGVFKKNLIKLEPEEISNS